MWNDLQLAVSAFCLMITVKISLYQQFVSYFHFPCKINAQFTLFFSQSINKLRYAWTLHKSLTRLNVIEVTFYNLQAYCVKFLLLQVLHYVYLVIIPKDTRLLHLLNLNLKTLQITFHAMIFLIQTDSTWIYQHWRSRIWNEHR